MAYGDDDLPVFQSDYQPLAKEEKQAAPQRRRRWCCALSLVCLLLLAVLAVVVWYVVLTADDVHYALVRPESGEREVFITAKRAEELLNSETGATVIDARTHYTPVVERMKPGHGDTIDGARRAPWRDFTVGGRMGQLKSVEEIERIFRDRGVSNDVPVVVFGGWKEEWGEEGRLYWQLDWLNHTQVYILYGGIFGWTTGGHVGRGRQGMGNFVARPMAGRYANRQQINELLMRSEDVVLIDGRKESEYEGATPHGSPRGGHIPTAVSYDWHRVFNEDGSGNLKPIHQLNQEFQQLGVADRNASVIPYCTSGIRAGFLYAVFRWMGQEPVANYAGSWWTWSHDTNLPIEL